VLCGSGPYRQLEQGGGYYQCLEHSFETVVWNGCHMDGRLFEFDGT
jgi:hypothetical protein